MDDTNYWQKEQNRAKRLLEFVKGDLLGHLSPEADELRRKQQEKQDK